jgi:hypothetical protein
MVSRRGRRCLRALSGRLPGVALTEVVIAVVVLALIVASIPPVLVLLTKFQYAWSEQRIAESITRNHLEYAKVEPYVAGNLTVPNPDYLGANATQEIPPMPNDNWEVQLAAVPIHVDPDTGERRPVDFAGAEQDEGIQEITVTVTHVDRQVLQGVAYKVDRQEIWRGR